MSCTLCEAYFVNIGHHFVGKFPKHVYKRMCPVLRTTVWIVLQYGGTSPTVANCVSMEKYVEYFFCTAKKYDRVTAAVL